MQKIGVGIVGFGRIGNEHAAWLRSCALAQPLAIMDTTPARREIAAAQGLAAYDNLDHLLADTRINTVLIATPTAMHCEHALAALTAGNHVMIEKPMALDLPQSRRLLAEATARGRLLSVFHNRRWDLDFLTLKNAVDTGLLGPIMNVESRLGQWSSCVGPAAKEWRPGWRNEAAFGGGGLFDWGSHFLDQLWRLLWPAKPLRVFAQLRANIWSRDCDDFARVLIDFDNGAAGLVEINTTTTRPMPRWHVDGHKGSLESPPSLQFDLKTWADFKFTPANDAIGKSVPPVATGLSGTQIWDRFAAAVLGEGAPAITAASVLPTMALLDAARQSSRDGVAVNLAEEIDWVY